MARKRSRTTFTTEQRQRMQELAEQLGWGLKKRDVATVDERCRAIGVRKDSFRSWMWNHRRDFIGGQSTPRGSSVAAGPSAAVTGGSVGGAAQHRRRTTVEIQKRGNLEFFKVLLPKRFEEALLLPPKVAQILGSRRELKLRLAGGEMMPTWDMKVSVHGKRGDVYLRDGWSKFVEANEICKGYFLVFSYDGEAGVLHVKIFETTSCRREYPHAGGSGVNLQ